MNQLSKKQNPLQQDKINYLYMKLTIRIFIFISFSIVLSSCFREEYANVKCFKDAGMKGEFCFYYDGNFHNGFGVDGFSIDTNNHLINQSLGWKHDISFPTYFKKIDINFDTIFYANQISCMEDRCKIFNATIIKDEWFVGLYYPFVYEGSYKFKISESEQYLLNHAVSLMKEVSPFVSVRQEDYNKVDADFRVYMRISSSRKSIKYFADMDNEGIDLSYYFINSVIKTIVANHIKKENKVSDITQKLIDVQFNEYKTYFADGMPPPPIPNGH